MVFEYFIEENGVYNEKDRIIWTLYGVEKDSPQDNLPRESYEFVMSTIELRDINDWIHEKYGSNHVKINPMTKT